MMVACDWDGVCVDGSSQEWLPGSQEALRRILHAGHRVIIHSCRANWPEGQATIEHKLSAAGLLIPVWTEPGKPAADVYLDDRAVYFDGSWTPILTQLERVRVRNRKAPSIKTRPKRSAGWQ